MPFARTYAGLGVLTWVGSFSFARKAFRSSRVDVSQEQAERADPDGYSRRGFSTDCSGINLPANTAETVERKLARYFENGAGEMWVAYPKMRRIWRYQGLQAHAAIERDIFTSPLLPGFEMDLAAIVQ